MENENIKGKLNSGGREGLGKKRKNTPMPPFHHEEAAMHKILLSKKGSLSGVTTGISVIVFSS